VFGLVASFISGPAHQAEALDFSADRIVKNGKSVVKSSCSRSEGRA